MERQRGEGCVRDLVRGADTGAALGGGGGGLQERSCAPDCLKAIAAHLEITPKFAVIPSSCDARKESDRSFPCLGVSSDVSQ